jgi:hypothetical protein
MSASTTTSHANRRWLSAAEFHGLGFEPTRPEIDFGMTWGDHHQVRVSFAPYGDGEDGFLYAYDRSADRYLLLAAHTQADRVQAVWHELLERTAAPDGYLAFAVLDHHDNSMRPDQARSLYWHCVGREFEARAKFAMVGADERFGAANAVVIERTAREAAEQLLLGAIAAGYPGTNPVAARYRVLDQHAWTGYVIAQSVPAAAQETQRLINVAARHGFRPQLTAVTQGWTTVSADRIPELEFAAARPTVSLDAPSVGL